MAKLSTFVGVKELRENLGQYITNIAKGQSFTVIKRSRPVFKISPIADDGQWEEVADFTKLKKGGVKISEVLSRLYRVQDGEVYLLAVERRSDTTYNNL
ncbi:MAG: hypothetical protein HY983_00950 [Candidatus Magasanikbacteria bacterium]|nr:hypothetical protein [Candidatus Magasanikbacteria bacterium]